MTVLPETAARPSPTGWCASPSEASGRFPAGSPVLRFESTTSGVVVAEVKVGPNPHGIRYYTVECVCLAPRPGGGVSSPEELAQ